MMNPRRIEFGTREYTKLEAVAKMLEAVSDKNAVYEVRDVYFDLGQNWMWTTISRVGGMFGGTQILSPRQWEMILIADNATQLAEAVDDIRSDEYFSEERY